MKNTRNGWIRGAVVMLLAASAHAQGTDDALARARAVEEVEQDLPRAAALYTAVAESAAASGEAKARAWLRLADVRQKLGDAAGAQQALASAAAGVGPAAQDAQRRQQVGQEGDGQAIDLIARLRRGEGTAGDLIWLGRGAVKPLVEWLERDRVDLTFVTSASAVLLRIGGPDVVAWLGHVLGNWGSLERRAVVRATAFLYVGPDLDSDQTRELRNITHQERNEVVPREVRAALTGFANDADPAVLNDALSVAPLLFTKGRMVDLVAHEDSRVRALAAQRLDCWEVLAGEDTLALRQRLLDVAARADVRVSPRPFKGRDTHEDRELWLAALERGFTPPLPPETQTAAPDAHAESVARVARALVPVDPVEPSQQQKTLAQFANFMLGAWTTASVDVELELVDLGYASGKLLGNNLWGYLVRTARREDWPKVFARLGRFGDAAISQLDNLAFEPSPEAFPPLRDFVTERLREGTLARLDDLIVPILRVGTRDAIDFVVRVMLDAAWKAAKDPREAERVLDRGMKRLLEAPDSEHIRSALRAIATSQEQGDPFTQARAKCLVQLVERVDAAAPEVFARAYPIDDAAGKTLGGILFGFAGGKPPWDAALVGAVLDACLATGLPRVWGDIERPSQSVNYDTLPWGHMPAPIAAAIRKHFASAPPEAKPKILKALAEGDSFDDVHPLLLTALRDPLPAVRTVALDGMRMRGRRDARDLDAITPLLRDESPGVVAAAIEAIGRTDAPGRIELVEPFLAHDNAYVRREAFRWLATGIDPEHGVEWVLRFKDHAAEVASTVCAIAEKTLDQRLVPVLIGLLRTDSRDDARKALDAIKFFHDETARWQRVFAGTDLGASSAAEALVLQTRATNAPDVRKLAVQSLGTLGVPEVLPVLIALVNDKDQAVADAARTAIEAINAKSRDR